MPTTPNGAPYPATGAANNLPGDMKALADWSDAQVQALVALIAQQATPAGAIMAWDDLNPPDGWHVLDGRPVSRADNPTLFARYGTSHGIGNGSTTFNLPNRKGRALVGRDPDQVEFNTIGKTGGAKTHTLSATEMPVHDHPWSFIDGGTDGSFTSNDRLQAKRADSGTSGSWGPGNGAIGEAGGGQPHNNLQPYAVTTWIIKAG